MIIWKSPHKTTMSAWQYISLEIHHIVQPPVSFVVAPDGVNSPFSGLWTNIVFEHCKHVIHFVTSLGRVTHTCVSKLTIIGSNNGLSPGRRQAIIWTNAGILLIGPLWTNFREIWIEIPTFSFKKMHLKVSSAKRRPFCVDLNVLNTISDFQTTVSDYIHIFIIINSSTWYSILISLISRIVVVKDST